MVHGSLHIAEGVKVEDTLEESLHVEVIAEGLKVEDTLRESLHVEVKQFPQK